MTTPDRTRLPDRDRIEADAAAWLARYDAGLTLPEHAQFEQWLAADSRHLEAWRELGSAWLAFDHPRRSGVAESMVLELAGRARRRRHWRVRIGVATTTLVAAAAAWVFLSRPLPQPSVQAPASPLVVRAERRVLPDQSVVELNQGARIEVDYRADRRDIRLLNGEVHFAVAKDPTRPFIVTVGTVQVQAVGTAFEMKLEAGSTVLLVTEGRVSVERTRTNSGVEGNASPGERPAAPAPILVPAGGLLVVPTSGAEPVHSALRVETLPSAEIEHRLEWRQPRIELSGTPLGEAVDAFNREAHVRLSVDDPQLAKLRMSGVFRADNVDGFVRLLQSNYGVKVTYRDNEIILRLGGSNAD